jgi:Holliday junction resolvase RusA-like endonuclease
MKIIADLTPVPLERMTNQKDSRKRFLPKRSADFRNALQWYFNANFRDNPLVNPLAVTLHFYKNANITAKTRYGDIDNLVKAVFDAGNEILWLDDSQIVELHAYKHTGAGKIESEVIEL